MLLLAWDSLPSASIGQKAGGANSSALSFNKKRIFDLLAALGHLCFVVLFMCSVRLCVRSSRALLVGRVRSIPAHTLHKKWQLSASPRPDIH